MGEIVEEELSGYPFYLVDAFVGGPFTGNPAGVCVVDEEKSAGWMQAVAAEINQAETAFLTRRASDGWNLRWFTPSVEVNLCGHATLAAAHALWQHAGECAGALEFHTRSGLLKASRDGERIRLDFPADPPTEVAQIPEALTSFLGEEPQWYGAGKDDVVAVLASADHVRNLRPNDALVAAFTRRGLIVTAPGDEPGLDMVSRFFAPNAGIPEDSVTGAAHCLLAVYWGQRLGKTRLEALQASQRTGRLALELADDRVYLSGKTRTALIGKFYGGEFHG